MFDEMDSLLGCISKQLFYKLIRTMVNLWYSL